MRFVNVALNGEPTLAVLREDLVYPTRLFGFVGDLLQLIDAGTEALARLRANLDRAGTAVAIGRVEDQILLAPIQRPRRDVFCAGKTYADHAAEYAQSGYDKPGAELVPKVPVVFFKLASSVVGPFDDIHSHQEATAELDYEAELGVILGRGGKNLSEVEAARCIFGYFLVNDVTARDWQKGHDQWVLGKSFDTFSPIGPVVVTADEVPDIATLGFRCYVNGELRQTGAPENLIFSVPWMISYFSRGITMMPGDLIATGSPLGPGIGFDPPRFLKPGDRVRIESPVLGTMENRVI